MIPHKLRLSKSDIQNLTCFIYNESNGLIASVFFQLPLNIKRHGVEVAIIAGLMAKYARGSAVPTGMTRDEYETAVRYGGLYHDIGAYLVYNQSQMYPATGERFLREQFSEGALSIAHGVILETVQFCGERYNGQGYPNKISGAEIPLHAGICAIADAVDVLLSCRMLPGGNRRFQSHIAAAKACIQKNRGKAYSPDAVACFMAASPEIFRLYKHWRKHPPLWCNSDIRPLEKPIDRQFH